MESEDPIIPPSFVDTLSNSDLALLNQMARNARAYGWEVGRGAPLSKIIDSTEGNPFLDNEWIKHLDEDAEESNFVRHARRELELLGEDEDVIRWFCNVMRVWASFGHSGGSHYACLSYMEPLLCFQNLTPLSSDPEEWVLHEEDISGHPELYQSKRNPAAMSTDGLETYYLVDEDPRVDRKLRSREEITQQREEHRREEGVTE